MTNSSYQHRAEPHVATTAGRQEEAPDPHELERRVRELHRDGLKIRDISALTGTHPLLVERIVGGETRHA